MKKSCPGCGKSIDALGDVQFCPFCGANVNRESLSGESEKYSPWDNRDNLGFFRALFDTWMESVFHPTKFFSKMPVRGGYGSPLLYGFIVGEIAVLFSLFWQGIFIMIGALGESYEQLEATGFSMVVLIVGALLSPITVIIGYFIVAGILHLCLLIVGGARRDFEATFRVVCYSAGVYTFNILPFCGGLIAEVWKIVLHIIGVKEVHEISTGKAVLAYFLPTIACCCFFILGSLFAFFLFGDALREWLSL